MGRACKTYRPRPICSAQGTKNPLPLGMGSVNSGQMKNDEPIHVHVCKGSPQKDATKVWITEDGPVLEHNKSKIPKKDLKRILAWIAMNDELIIKKWQFHFSK